jgi:hypothetical protein
VNYRRSDDGGWEGEVKSLRPCGRRGRHEGEIIAQNGYRYGSHQALEAQEGRYALKRPTTLASAAETKQGADTGESEAAGFDPEV